jgi:tRNA threonylcarbamoyladenosine biosynthesis protein TsaB
MAQPTLLAIDTATDACSVAVLADGAIAAHRSVLMARGHAEALMPMVVEALAAASLVFADLGAVGVTVGPGAFTGLRIGLSAARGIGLAAGIPVLGATTLEVLAHGVPEDERAEASVVAAIESKRADLYVQAFGPDLGPLGKPAALMPEALADALPAGRLVLAGDGAARAAEALSADDGAGRVVLSATGPHPDARVLAALVAARLAEFGEGLGGEIGDGLDGLAAPEPLYLRPPDAKRPAGGGRLRS